MFSTTLLTIMENWKQPKCHNQKNQVSSDAFMLRNTVQMLTNNVKLKNHIQLLLMDPKETRSRIFTNMKEQVEFIYCKQFFIGKGELKRDLQFLNQFLLEYSCFTMLRQLLLYSKVSQLYSPSFFNFLPISVTRVLSTIPCAMQQVLIIIYFINSTVHMSIPISQFILFPSSKGSLYF